MNDPLLRELLGASDSDARAREIERLIVEVTQPLAERILSRYSRTEGTVSAHDAEDILSTVNVRMLRKLQSVADSEEAAVRDLADYVATLTYNTINDHLRRRYPERTRLKNRLRYALTHDPRLALWSTEGGLTAGLAKWKERAPGSGELGTLRRVAGATLPNELVEIFRVAGQPMLLDTLVETTADLWGIADAAPAVVEPRAHDDVAAKVEQRQFLGALWREIRLLSAQQRKALLLNLREGETVSPIALLVYTGTATFDEIAATMELRPEELTSIWNELPLDDLRIGEMLGITRQQVINLRKSARARLARRLMKRNA